MTLRTTLAALILLAISVSPAVAQNDVYDNGPTDGQTWAYFINFGFVTSDSFNYTDPNNCGWGGEPCPLDGVVFAVWLYPGDVLQSAEVSITSSEFGGTTYFDQTVSFTQSGCFSNDMSFNVCTETGSFPNLYLNSGTYWLNLQNAQVNNGDPVYWDQNAGPSLASNNSVGTIPSESFTILGSTTSWCNACSANPEPSSFVLLASGVLGVLAFGSRRMLR